MDSERLQTALRDFIETSKGLPEKDFPDVEGYVTALRKAPQLIESESNPLLFLRYEQGDAIAAARRLLNYWSFRLKIFGPDKAFVPLKEALSPSDVKLVLSGAVTHLPCDAQGRDVFCADLSRRSKGFGDEVTGPSRARAFFYILSLCFSNPRSQSEGMVFILPLTEKSTMNAPGIKLFGGVIRKSLPIKSHSIHLVCCPKPGTASIFKNCLIPAYSENFSGWSETKNFLKVHIGKTRADLHSKLEKHGLGKECIPEQIGGLWKYGDWENRISRALLGASSRGPLKKRVFEEREVELKPPPEAAVVSAQLQDGKKEYKIQAKNLNAAASVEQHTGLRAEACKRGPERRPLGQTGEPLEKRPSKERDAHPEPTSMATALILKEKDQKSQSKKLAYAATSSKEAEQARAKKCKTTGGTAPRVEISPLEAVGEPIEGDWKGRFSEEIVRSFSKVMSQDPGRCADQDLRTKEEKADFLKKRDALYSRRKYYRKKLRIENLISSREDLLTERKKLRAESKRLEELIEKAKKIASKVDESLDAKPASVAVAQTLSPQSAAQPSQALMDRSLPVPQPTVTARTTTKGSCHSISDFLRQRKQESLESQRGAATAVGPSSFLACPSSISTHIRTQDLPRVMGSTETRSPPPRTKPTLGGQAAILSPSKTTHTPSSQNATKTSQEQLLLNFLSSSQQLRLPSLNAAPPSTGSLSLIAPPLASACTGFENQQCSTPLPTTDASILHSLLGGSSLSNDNALMILKLLESKRLEERATSSMLGQQVDPRGLQQSPEERMLFRSLEPAGLGTALRPDVRLLSLLASQGNAEALQILLEMKRSRQFFP